MQAAVLVQFSVPLEVREVGKPVCGSADAVVRVEACGVVGSPRVLLAFIA